MKNIPLKGRGRKSDPPTRTTEKKPKMPTPAALKEQASRGLAMDLTEEMKRLSAMSVRAALLNHDNLSRAIRRAVDLVMSNIRFPGIGK